MTVWESPTGRAVRVVTPAPWTLLRPATCDSRPATETEYASAIDAIMLFVPQWLLHGSQDLDSSLASSSDIPSSPEALLSAKLEHYIANGARPPSARFDPATKKEAPPLSITTLWKYGAFVATKGVYYDPRIYSLHAHISSSDRACL